MNGLQMKKRRGRGVKAKSNARSTYEVRPPWKPTPGSAESSERTRVEILWAAQRLLASKGYAAFTMRGVSDVARLPLGTLTYHYKTKRSLLRAVIVAMLREYEREIGEFFKPTGNPPMERLKQLVAWLIRDSTTSATNRLFREIWAMALHDPYVAESVDDLYEGAASLIALFLREVYPHLSIKQAEDLTRLMLMVSEGAIPIYGTPPMKRSSNDGVVQLAQIALARIAADLEEKATQVSLGSTPDRCS